MWFVCVLRMLTHTRPLLGGEMSDSLSSDSDLPSPRFFGVPAADVRICTDNGAPAPAKTRTLVIEVQPADGGHNTESHDQEGATRWDDFLLVRVRVSISDIRHRPDDDTNNWPVCFHTARQFLHHNYQLLSRLNRTLTVKRVIAGKMISPPYIHSHRGDTSSITHTHRQYPVCVFRLLANVNKANRTEGWACPGVSHLKRDGTTHVHMRYHIPSPAIPRPLVIKVRPAAPDNRMVYERKQSDTRWDVFLWVMTRLLLCSV